MSFFVVVVLGSTQDLILHFAFLESETACLSSLVFHDLDTFEEF